MSSLNLVPNPAIMVIQAGIFLANLVVVKKFLLEPYLAVRDERVKLTYGSQDLAESLRQENELAAEKIHFRLQEVGTEARSLRDAALAHARTRRDEILQKATAAAQQIVVGVRTEISRDMEEQRRGIPVLVQNLSRQVLEKIVPA